MIFLTGFMGSGKSTIGPILANTLGFQFVDLDKLIEERAGQRIVEIFETKGEKHFRELERQLLAEVASASDFVISLGGGTIANEENVRLIKEHGALVYLKLSPEEVLRRVSHRNDRPMLKDEQGRVLPPDELKRRVLSLLQHREQYYNQADIIVSADLLSVGKTVDEIVKHLRPFLEHPLSERR
ncbi:MAG TPA: shikimate kinase [Bacteroidota bacterium]|nr:shikimate kinase [Bacteroidota bacterium]